MKIIYYESGAIFKQYEFPYGKYFEYYPSEKIKCKETLWLIYDIIESTSGLPIGNYTSQYFGNIYLYKFLYQMLLYQEINLNKILNQNV